MVNALLIKKIKKLIQVDMNGESKRENSTLSTMFVLPHHLPYLPPVYSQVKDHRG